MSPQLKAKTIFVHLTLKWVLHRNTNLTEHKSSFIVLSQYQVDDAVSVCTHIHVHAIH